VAAVEEMSGTRQVWRRQESHRGLSVSHGLAQMEEAYIPSNLIRRLGQGVALCFQPAQLARLVVTAPVATARCHDLEHDPRFYTLAGQPGD